MARRYGSNLSSLINAARSAYEKQQSLNDQIQAYEWDLSAKTAEDADKYMSYIRNRQQQVQTTDPSKALSFQQKLTSIQRAFSSAEISRASLAINYGQANDRDKYNKIVQLAQNAYETGDFALGARLEMQASTLQIKMQNAASAGAAKAYEATKRGFDDAIKRADSAIKDYEAAYKLGHISKSQYVEKTSVAYEAKRAAIQNAIDRGDQLKQGDLDNYITDMNKLTTGSGREFLGTAGSKLRYRPELKITGTDEQGNPTIKDAPIMGWDRIVVGDETAKKLGVDGSQIQQVYSGNPDIPGALKKLGISGLKDGKTLTENPYTGELGQYQVFVNDPSNPTYAYARGAKGEFYLVNRDGTLMPAKDFNQKTNGTVEFAPDDLKRWQQANNLGEFSSPVDTFQTKGAFEAAKQVTGKFALPGVGSLPGVAGGIPGFVYGAGRQLSNLLDVSSKLRAKAQAAEAARIAEGKRMFAEQQAALKAAQQAQAGREAKIAQSKTKDYWAPAPYRDQPLIAAPKNQAEVAYNIGSQTGIKLPKLGR